MTKCSIILMLDSYKCQGSARWSTGILEDDRKGSSLSLRPPFSQNSVFFSLSLNLFFRLESVSLFVNSFFYFIFPLFFIRILRWSLRINSDHCDAMLDQWGAEADLHDFDDDTAHILCRCIAEPEKLFSSFFFILSVCSGHGKAAGFF